MKFTEVETIKLSEFFTVVNKTFESQEVKYFLTTLRDGLAVTCWATVIKDKRLDASFDSEPKALAWIESQVCI